MANPFKAFMDIRKKELPLALFMFGYFFLVITIFWVLKPIKKGLFIDYYKDVGGFELFDWVLKGSQAEQLAKVLNMFVAFVAVMVFTWFARNLRRQQLTFIFSGFSVACLVLYSFIIEAPAEVTLWSFYLFGDLFNTLMVATFFAFLNDSVTPENAKRLYGFIVLGGVSGGAFGSMFVRVQIDAMSNPQWMWICVALTAAIVGLAWGAGRIVDADPPEAAVTAINGPEAPEPKKGNIAAEGAKLVFRSRYLLAIVAIVGLYEVVSTILDFQFTATVEHFVDETGRHFATMGVITNVFALVVQLFFTSWLMKRFGLGVALLVMPVVILGSAGLFLAIPILWTGSFLNTADNGLNYSVNQSAREALYTPTTREEKYKAKAFIDMFVQRAAKALAVGLNLGITAMFVGFEGVRWLSLVTVLVTVVWFFAARYAGRRFNEMTDQTEAAAEAA